MVQRGLYATNEQWLNRYHSCSNILRLRAWLSNAGIALFRKELAEYISVTIKLTMLSFVSPVYYNIQHKQRKRRFGPHLHNLSSSELAPVPPQNEKYTAQATVNGQRQTALGSSSFSPRWYLRVLELIMEYIQREHCTIASYVDHSQRLQTYASLRLREIMTARYWQL